MITDMICMIVILAIPALPSIMLALSIMWVKDKKNL